MSLDARSWLLPAVLTLLGAAADVSAADACPEHLRFLKEKCGEWQSHLLPKVIPSSRGNAHADNEGAAALGMRIFYDNRFSRPGSGAACVNCHDPEHAFAEEKPTSYTISKVDRNAPDLLNAAWYSSSLFWDGKVDTLWSAPLFTFEQDAEMGSSRLRVAHTVVAIYRNRYEQVFGPAPDLSDARRFPAAGKPGMPEFDRMNERDKQVVNQVYANVGKSLEAYIRKLAAGRSPFDDFLTGSATALDESARRGMVAFGRQGCGTCHSGPTFTDEGFHDLGYPRKPSTAKDPARAAGILHARQWPFTATGKFADAGPVTARAVIPSDEPGGYRTPSLRNVASTFPYGHDGSFATLEQVIAAHARVLPGKVPPSAEDTRDIVALLRSLSGRPPMRPWSYWPGG